MATQKFYPEMSNAEMIAALNDVWAAAGVAGTGTLSAADQIKLNGIQAEATKNSTDIALRDRTTHTGAQAISTVTGLQAALDAKQATQVLKTINGLTIVGTGNIEIAAGALSTADRTKLDSIAQGATVNSTDVILLNRANHTGSQAIATVTGLQSALNEKQNVLQSGVTIKTINGEAITGAGNIIISGAGLSTADRIKFDGIAIGATVNQPDTVLLGRANHTGTQGIETVAGLQTALNGKLTNTDFKTINGIPLTGTGNIVTAGGGGSGFTHQLLTLVGNGTTTWNAAIGNVGHIFLTSNTTLAFPTNLGPGPFYLVVDQDATGGRVITFNGNYKVTRMATSAGNTRAIYLFVPDIGYGTAWGGPQHEGLGLTNSNQPLNSNTAMYSRILAIYFEGYDPTYPITQVPLDFNVIYLFNAVPKESAGQTVVANVRDQLGDGTFFWPDYGVHISPDKIQTCRARGQRCILTCGGADNGFSFTTRAQS